jgi:hypothetical protein
LFANLQVCRERGCITHGDFELLLGLLRCHGPARVRECKRLADSCVRVIRPPALLTGCRGTGRPLSNAVLLPYHREVTIESEEWRRWTDLEGFEPHSPSVQWLWEYDLSPGGPDARMHAHASGEHLCVATRRFDYAAVSGLSGASQRCRMRDGLSCWRFADH